MSSNKIVDLFRHQYLRPLQGLVWLLFTLLFACSNADKNPSSTAPANRIAEPIALKVGEGFSNPLGYYEAQPRFSWQLPNIPAVLSQQGYQLQVSSVADFSSGMLWDTGEVNAKNTAWIKYQGKPLASRQAAFWRVRYWNQEGQQSVWSQTAKFELGLLNNSDWQGQWVRHPEANETYTATNKKGSFTNALYRPQYLRRQFVVTDKIKKARLYVTSKGIFKAYVNGQAIADDVMTPGWTPYHKRIETLTYDVTQQLQQGENTLAATVAEGWYGGRIIGPYKRDVEPHALLAQLEITYHDDTTVVVATDKLWRASTNGPIRAAGNYDGETYDANLEMPGWSTIHFDDHAWKPVLAEPLAREVALLPKRHATAKIKHVLNAQRIVDVEGAKPGVVVFDLGQNMLGVPRISIPVVANQKVTIRFAEALQKGAFYTKNLRSAKATDHYIPAKDGQISYTPTFTFHGFRYVELSGFDTRHAPQLDWVQGLVQHSDFNVTADFSASHAKLNQLADNVVWGLRGNFLDIPTDCPQRDERLGWTGDAQVFAQPSMYMADVYGFWSAWLQSLREDQANDGRIPNFVPIKPGRHDKGTSSGWGDAAVIIPWELYMMTGDKQVLRENYEMMQAWVAFIETKTDQNTSTMGGFGDWLQPFPQRKKKANRGDTPIHLISTAYLARSLDYMTKTAVTLGLPRDAAKYSERYEIVREAFRHAFYDDNVRVKSEPTQTSYLLPLAFGLFDPDDTEKAQQHLLQTIEEANNHLRTGFLGTPLLAPVLQSMGRSDLMFDILFKETYPSWFHSINNGATTTWERWDSYSQKDGFHRANMNSLNHYAYGAVAEWFYTGILGVRSQSPGFEHFVVGPQFTPKLSSAKGSIQTVNGIIDVNWQVVGDQLSMTLVVPANSLATLQLPSVQQLLVSQDKRPVRSEYLPAGSYRITGVLVDH